MNNKAVFILSVALAFVLGILAGNLYQRCAARGCATMACAHGAGHASLHGACGGASGAMCGRHGHGGWRKHAMADCCARTAAGDPQECCAKHEQGETQACCARAKDGLKGEAAGLEITGAAAGDKQACCHRGAAK